MVEEDKILANATLQKEEKISSKGKSLVFLEG